MTEKDNRMSILRRELGQIDGRIERLVDAIADGELPLDVIKQKIHTEEDRKRELSAELRYFQLPSPTIPDIETFRNELIEALDDPGAKKAALRGVIRQIIVHTDAALNIECSLQTCFQPIALRGIEQKAGFIRGSTFWLGLQFVPPQIGAGYRARA